MRCCLVPSRTGVAILKMLVVGGLFAGSVSAQAITEEASTYSPPPLSDLSFNNLFSAGWNEPWARRQRTNGAPDLTLLRVQGNLLLRALRTDFSFEHATDSSPKDHSQFVNQLIEYSVNRRLMFAAQVNYLWVRDKDEDSGRGVSYGGFVRLQLVDLPRTSYAFNIRAAAPREGIGETQTPLGFALAGWHDLTPLSLPRVGLYWHVQEETYLGPHPPGARKNQLTYGLDLAKTWTSPGSPFGNLTTFLENYARTELDGNRGGQSYLTLTPGFRFNYHRRHAFIAGVDFPVTAPKPFSHVYRLSYIFSF